MFQKEKIFRIGIDWISIYNFEIEFDEDKVSKMEQTTEEYYQERIYIEEPIFTIDNSIKFFNDGTTKTYKNLRFNPNKILYGQNVHNSRGEEVLEALELLKKILKERGIEIGFDNASIRDLEININFEMKFENLKETLELLFSETQNLKKIANYNGGSCYKDMFSDKTIQCNWGTYGAIAYCKNSETKDEIGFPVTRLEWRFKNSIYSYYCKKLELDSSLESFFKNFEIVEKIFRDYTHKKMFEKSFKKIDEELKPNLEKGFIEFKKNNKLGKNLGKKQKRDVFKYLEDKYWIFDSSFLKTLVEEHDKIHKTREFDRIDRKFSHHNNLEKLDYLMRSVF